MRILTIADEEAKRFYDFYKPGMLDEYDLIISCGDLSRHYLEFLVTMAHCPLLYVPGNHDDSFVQHPPEGCICIDDDIFEYQGVRFLGLGGSFKYRNSGEYMYTETEMKRRILKLKLKLFRHKGFDVLVTHSPIFEYGDKEYLAHRGFLCFQELLKKYKPKYMIHGHIHLNYGYKLPKTYTYQDVTIINAYEYYNLDY
ncbi:MAG: metallophosphoesterase [Bacillota bacterium]|nr:metallophosphoesterase [Bacillota bacterium]